MNRTTNIGNTIAALQAAIDCLERLDLNSAIEYTTVAVQELVDNHTLPGYSLLYATQNSYECAQAGVIDRWQKAERELDKGAG